MHPSVAYTWRPRAVALFLLRRRALEIDAALQKDCDGSAAASLLAEEITLSVPGRTNIPYFGLHRK